MDTRKEEIFKLRESGKTFVEIGRILGFSRSRIHQIYSGYDPNNINIYKGDILERDNHECQWQEKCNGKFRYKDLIIHHIDFDNRNNDYDNLITLCKFCHKYFHLKFHIDKEKEIILQKGHTLNVKLKILKCRNCKKESEIVESSTHSFCNESCQKEFYNNKFKRECNHCNKIFIVPKTVRFNYYRDPNKFKRKSYCSKKCYLNFVKSKKG